MQQNLVIVMADQLAAHVLEESEDVHLPHLRALAADSVAFGEAHCAFPLCVPSRASMLTGVAPHELGMTGNAAKEGFRPELGHLLRSHGYATGWAGKWHCPEPEQGPDSGFDIVSEFGDIGLVDSAVEWLERTDGPFALVVSFDDPHTICEFARDQAMPYGSVTPPAASDCPPLPPHHLPGPYEPEAVRYEQDAAASMYGTLGYGPDEWRQYRWAYRRLVERVDAEVGALRAHLERLGLAESTHIVLTSDHGDGDGAHRCNQKLALFPEVTRIPFLVHVAGGTPGAREFPVNVGLDLLPTLTALLGLPTPAGLRGADVLDPPTERREVVVETLMGGGRATPPTTGRALVAEEGTYVVYSWGRHREQLFAPGDRVQQRNLALESRHAQLLESLRRRLLDHCLATDDPFAKKLVFPADTTDDERRRVFGVPY